MSLLVALSLAERENGQCESSVYNMDSGDFLLKLLHGCAPDDILKSIKNQAKVTQNQLLTTQRTNIKTIAASEVEAELFEMLTATTPKKFSNFVRQRSIFANNFANQVTHGYIPSYIADTIISANEKLSVMYQKRNILDLASNLVGSTAFVKPSSIPRTKKDMLENCSLISWLNGGKSLPLSMDMCADVDCKFQEPVFEKKLTQQ